MSGSYLFQSYNDTNLHKTATLMSSQIACVETASNYYCTTDSTLMGLVSQDKYTQGIMPCFLEKAELWGMIDGVLYESDSLLNLRKKHPDIRTDLEMFAHLYRTGNLLNILPKLNGAFFVMLVDPKSRTIIAANDRYGLYPMYWAHSDKGFCLACRVLCPVLAGVVSGDWDLKGISQFLTLDDFIGETTLVEGVSVFPQASILIKQPEGIAWKRYWSYDFKHIPYTDIQELSENLGSSFITAVNRQTTGHKRIGITLSGGLDSRSIASASNRLGIYTKTLTWGKPDSFDRILAKEVSSILGTKHYDCDYEISKVATLYKTGMCLTEGLINYFDCHMLFHLDILKKHTDIVLNGYAGDLILGGSYLRRSWMHDLTRDSLAQRIFTWRNSLLPEYRLKHIIPSYSALDNKYSVSTAYTELINATSGIRPSDIADTFFLENRVRRSTSMGTVIMRAVTESAACFFDYDLLDLITSIPYQLRYDHRIYISMLKNTLPKGLDVRWQRTLLPPSAPLWMNLPAKAALKALRIIESRTGWPHIHSRQSPVDFASCLRGPLRPWMEQVINDPHPHCESILSEVFCKHIWERHLSGKDETRLLGVIASLRGFSELLAMASSKRALNDIKPENTLKQLKIRPIKK